MGTPARRHAAQSGQRSIPGSLARESRAGSKQQYPQALEAPQQAPERKCGPFLTPPPSSRNTADGQSIRLILSRISFDANSQCDSRAGDKWSIPDSSGTPTLVEAGYDRGYKRITHGKEVYGQGIPGIGTPVRQNIFAIHSDSQFDSHRVERGRDFWLSANRLE
jgi:hypothetical protein